LAFRAAAEPLRTWGIGGSNRFMLTSTKRTTHAPSHPRRPIICLAFGCHICAGSERRRPGGTSTTMHLRWARLFARINNLRGSYPWSQVRSRTSTPHHGSDRCEFHYVEVGGKTVTNRRTSMVYGRRAERSQQRRMCRFGNTEINRRSVAGQFSAARHEHHPDWPMGIGRTTVCRRTIASQHNLLGWH
jgi:hypothetical protein